MAIARPRALLPACLAALSLLFYGCGSSSGSSSADTVAPPSPTNSLLASWRALEHAPCPAPYLAISRRVGKRCQWLQKKGGFSRIRSCRRKTYVPAKGTARWTYKQKAKLRTGTYGVVPRAIDSVFWADNPTAK